MSAARVIIAGQAGGTHVGSSLLRAADELGMDAWLLDVACAYAGPRLVRSIAWRAARRAPRGRSFGVALLRMVEERAADLVLAVGLAPIEPTVLRELGARGVRRVAFLTDDPWNPALCGPRWRRTLPQYDRIFTTRTANLVDLRAAGCRRVTWLPFGYDPVLFRPPAERPEEDHDVVFAGGADADRAPLFAALAEAGFSVALYGGYWNRFRGTRALARGHADPAALPDILAAGRVALCLVRRANRDGHAMRSLELPAVGTCMLVEDTPEHRVLLGEDGEAVVYFSDPPSMRARLEALLEAPAERRRLAAAVHARVTAGGHTYRQRLLALMS